jgi:UDP-N-acetylmuramoyl-tripeptide--D-alanyl-D-alanine ligase
MIPMMMLSEAGRVLRADLIGDDVGFFSVSSDSRTLPRGALFVAITGEHFDGHRFLAAAAGAGAAAALIERRSHAEAGAVSLPVLRVDHSREALAALAGYWRSRFRFPVIGVVGSNGKTTTKEMIAAILRAQWDPATVLATAGNLNNDIGVPLSVLKLREEHEVAVFELGMNHAGETADLAAIAAATIGLINNAQREHQEFMANVQAVAEEHAALLDSLPDSGVAVLNADDGHYEYWRSRAGQRRVVSFGLERPADVTAAWTSGPRGTELSIKLPGGTAQATLRIPGEHNVRNALAAAAAATAAGALPPAVAAGLNAFEPAKGRLQVKPGRRGATLVDDSYNANPDSVRAAIDVLARAPGDKLLVLGDMGEVGGQGPQFHREIGGYARDRGIARLLALGDASRDTVQAFGAAGQHFADVEALLAVLDPLLAPGLTVLVKGSRFMRMERVVEAIVEARG